MKNIRTGIPALLPVIFGALAFHMPASYADSIGVEVANVEVVKLTQTVSAVGTLSSENAVIIRPEISGRISVVNFKEGSAVKAGDTLIELDSAIASAELEQAQAQLRLASSQHSRASQLSNKGFVSGQARDESASQLKVSQASVALATAHLAKTVIKAPFDGLVGLRTVSVGDYVSPGQDIVPLESMDPLNVDFRVPEQFLAHAKVGASVVVSFDALPEETREGKVSAVSPKVDEGGRSILLRAKVPNQDYRLRPGMFARVRLQFADKPALMVPETAIAPEGDANYVYRLDTNKVSKTDVVLGLRRDGRVEIVHGLNEGDIVLVSGLQKVFEGAEVNVINNINAGESDQND